MNGYTDRYCPLHGWVTVTCNVVHCPHCQRPFIRDRPRRA